MTINFYDKEKELQAAQERKTNAENAITNLGEFSYSRQSDYDKALENLLNRKDFRFDVNNDALYKQVKDNYANLGKLAMQDTMGQASAMTGGYGNSYAQTVGQQAYNNYMQKATDIIPELYNMALNRYNLDTENLARNLSALNTDRSTKYSEYQDAYNRAANERSYYGNEYDNLYNLAWQAQQAKAASNGSSSRSSSSSKSSGSSSSNKGVKASTIMEKAYKYQQNFDNNGLANYLEGLVADGSLTEDEAADYYDKYAITDILGAKTGTSAFTNLLNNLKK